MECFARGLGLQKGFFKDVSLLCTVAAAAAAFQRPCPVVCPTLSGRLVSKTCPVCLTRSTLQYGSQGLGYLIVSVAQAAAVAAVWLPLANHRTEI